MHKLFGGNKTKAPSSTNLQIQKTKQIESLRKLSPIEILRDVEYRVLFSQGTNNITLVIALGAQFPQDKPIISVTPAVSHPWVDADGQLTGCPAVNNFSMHSDLGQVVQSVLDEFNKCPPVPIPPQNRSAAGASSYPSYHPPSYPPPSYVNPGSEPSPCVMAGAPPVPPRLQSGWLTNAGLESAADGDVFPDFSMPNVLKAFPELKEKKLMELQELIENDERLLEMVQELPQLKAFSDQRQALSDKCVSLAQNNLSHRPKIKEMKEEVAEKMAMYDELRGSFEARCDQHMTQAEQFRPSHIQTNLKVAILQAEEAAESLMNQFLTKKMDIEDFTQSFLEIRKLCHMRKAKEEKLSHIILSQGDQY